MEFIKSILGITLGIAGFFAVFLLLYGIVRVLPKPLRTKLEALPFIGIALVFAIGGLFVAAVRTVVKSFIDDNGHKFVGLANYRVIADDLESRLAVFNSFVWVFVGTFLTIVLGLTIARFADGVKGEKLAKTLVFLPVAISLVGAGITWKFMYAERGVNFNAGLLNEVTRFLHLPASMGGGDGRNWLLERGFGPANPPGWAPGFNTFLLIVIFVWSQVGIATVVLSAAVKSVPQELVEAATVDGATNRVVFYKVILPYIKGTIATVTSLVALGSLKAFDIVAATTGGNFGTTTLATEFYRKFFTQLRDGVGSAIAVLLFILCFPIVVWNRRVQKQVDATM